MRAIPMSVRERIVQLYNRGKSTREIAEIFGFCIAAIRRVRQQYKD
jgi:transposase